MNRLIGLIILILLCFSTNSFSQISEGGSPYSFQQSFKNQFSNEAIVSITVPAFDLKKAQAEDQKLPGSVRFAKPINVQYNLQEHGSWTDLPNGDRLWRLRVESKTAHGIFVRYSNFYMPAGAKFFMYNDDHSEQYGAYTFRNNKASGQFLTGMIKGESAILEYYEPKAVAGQGIVNISGIFHSYDYVAMQSDSEFNVYQGFGDALPCHININCPEGANYQDHKRSVVRMLRVFEEGLGWCTATLINNTNEDATPYLLSAYHCIAGYTEQLDMWRFDFAYEAPGCADVSSEPAYQSLMGCVYRSGREETDFLLLELTQSIPASYNPRFVGWNNDDNFTPATSTIVHHPQGDVKKITKDNDPAIIFPQPISWNNNVTTPANHHFRALMDVGTIENGSSGSVLIDENGHIVGQLHGGNANCSLFVTYFGRFSLSWDAGGTMDSRLKEWLDPTNSGATTLGVYEPSTLSYSNIHGIIKTPVGDPVANVIVTLNGNGINDAQVTASDGAYAFTNIPEGGNYSITLAKNFNATNGLSPIDILLMQQHILGIQSFSDPMKEMAADVNNSGDVSPFDILQMRQIILNITSTFPSQDSWLFSPSTMDINNLSGNTTLDFMGIKTGDVNYSADPSQ